MSTAVDQSTHRDLADEPCLLIPTEDVHNPELSVVVPALNEELTISQFIDWCKDGLARAGIVGEILIVDSSSDQTADIALAKGARVLKTPKRGLGRAYVDSIPHIRGKYVLMGDADCTYDFRELRPFVEKLREGYEFVMGSRFRGTIEAGSMPLLHRYFGTPITTWILNILYSTRFTDIHCGMRAVTREALVRMDLSSQKWEYASEMILKAVHLQLRITEAPIHFYKDRHGRISNVKRAGWLTPWQAGWDSLQVMFVYGADFFLYKPGLALALIGLIGTGALSFGPMRVGASSLTLHTQFLTSSLALIGLFAIYMAIVAKVANDLTGMETRRWLKLFAYNRSVVTSLVLVVAGLLPNLWFVTEYVDGGFALSAGDVRVSHLAVTGLLLIIIGFLNFAITLVLHAVAKRVDTGRG